MFVHEVSPSILVADLSGCTSAPAGAAVVHACKSPCHQQALGYRKSLPSSHPNYLALERENDLYLNLIDPPVPLFKLESFLIFLEFAKGVLGGSGRLVIHCNQGLSRAPSLALVALAMITHRIPSDSFSSARSEFESLYPQYNPGAGIATFLTQNWESLAIPPAA